MLTFFVQCSIAGCGKKGLFLQIVINIFQKIRALLSIILQQFQHFHEVWYKFEYPSNLCLLSIILAEDTWFTVS